MRPGYEGEPKQDNRFCRTKTRFSDQLTWLSTDMPQDQKLRIIEKQLFSIFADPRN